jgi:hypothetical protein
VTELIVRFRELNNNASWALIAPTASVRTHSADGLADKITHISAELDATLPHLATDPAAKIIVEFAGFWHGSQGVEGFSSRLGHALELNHRGDASAAEKYLLS